MQGRKSWLPKQFWLREITRLRKLGKSDDVIAVRLNIPMSKVEELGRAVW